MVLVARRGCGSFSSGIPRGRIQSTKCFCPSVGWGFGAELGTYLGVRDVKVDAYWKFSGSDNLDEVYVTYKNGRRLLTNETMQRTAFRHVFTF